ncbi:polysaccharide deacetylase family protein [Paraflavitalea speifideaquila]|uniref:polysaccharide deacetylase family protein n=1 Tax=Paraflavitalea speifideaquila TaxID=3076558 RepID=UPI0028EBFEA1|nr:polysaccharide deacetylase family protein [Paraflavitalea speifideiaquila]
METNNDEGGPTAFSSYRPLLLLLVLMACAKSTRRSETNNILLNHQSTVKVVEKPTPPAPKKKRKKIYLTFDDGPNRGTRKVLGIVQQEQVPVTFFLIGEHVFASTSQRATWDSLRIDSSIELCNHSHTHAWKNHYNKFYDQPDSVVKDFKRCQDSLDLINTITRTPGRNIWRVDTLRYTDLRKSAAAADSLQQAGFTIIGWDLEWHYDHKSFSLKNKSDELLLQIDSLFAGNKTKIPEHLVLLAHDQVYDDPNDSSELHQLIKS